jgi:hypothetical protein
MIPWNHPQNVIFNLQTPQFFSHHHPWGSCGSAPLPSVLNPAVHRASSQLGGDSDWIMELGALEIGSSLGVSGLVQLRSNQLPSATWHTCQWQSKQWFFRKGTCLLRCEICVYMYMYMYMNIYIYMHVYIYMYDYIDIYIYMCMII